MLETQPAAELLKAFSHATRLAILQELMAGPKCVSDMEELLPVRQANISQHLAVLRHARLVDYAQDGALRCYYLCRPHSADHSCLGVTTYGEHSFHSERSPLRNGAFIQRLAAGRTAGPQGRRHGGT